MGTVSFLVKKRVMEEFYFGFLAEQDETKEDGPIQPFDFLDDLNDEQMFALLDKEEPPVIAMILAQLEAEKKMTVLNKLDPELKGQVLIELGSLDDIPLEGIIEVGARLKEKSTYLPRTADFSRGGAKEIADMLSGMSSNDQERYMQTLQNEDPELYAAVKVLFLTFEDIMEKFPEDLMRTLLNSIELDILPIAFKGLEEEKINELKDMLPQKKQAMYNEDLASKPQPKREVDNARKLFVDAVKQMEKDGAINLEDILSGGEMIE
tara:strand:- start:9 stop:803 length:795 start_codon:yes stop_codon:yes gene_type:complete